MGYENEKSSLSGHADVVNSPDVQKFLDSCEYIRTPGPDEAQRMAVGFVRAPDFDGDLPDFVIGTDGSPSSESMGPKIPETKVAYIKVGMIATDMRRYAALRKKGPPVDPFEANRCFTRKSIALGLPSANIRYKGAKTVRDGFRLAFHEALSSDTHRTGKGGPRLVDALFAIEAARETDDFAVRGDHVLVESCPNLRSDGSPCGYSPGLGIPVPWDTLYTECPKCGGPIYASDHLNLHTSVNEFGEAGAAVNSAMLAIEHLIPVQYMLAYHQKKPDMVGRIGFIVDGPLALFSSAKKATRGLQAFHHNARKYADAKDMQRPLIFGAQKTGQLVDFARILRPYIGNNEFLLVDDDYRYENVKQSNHGGVFGIAQYYGQDFIYTTGDGKFHILCLPYPTQSRDNPTHFAAAKANPYHYEDLARTLAVVRMLQDSKYENGLIPIARAHEHVSISMNFGGKILADMAKEAISRRNAAEDGDDPLSL